MPSMKQNPKTDYGRRGETGEKEPKGAARADTSGERSERKVAGVAMGEADKTGSQEGGVGRKMGGHETGEYNTGRAEKVCYEHKRLPHDQDK